MYRLLKPAALFIMTAVLLVSGTILSRGAGTTSEGCMDQWMFNGIWRVKATKVEPLMDGTQQVGWQVTEVWRNGTTQQIAPADSFLKDQVLELEDGSSVAASVSNSGTMSMGVVASHSFAQAAQFTYVQQFRTAGLNFSIKPKALAITFDGTQLAKIKNRPQFTTSHYNYRIKLDCTASGAQAAQGGSFEIPGAQGCMNQWMSNGVWRMRVTAVGPDLDGTQQIGWMVTQDWASLVKRPIAPADTNITDEQIVLTSGDTISSTNSAGTEMNWTQLGMRTFPPGGSYTHQQRFRTPNLNVSDKPVRLLVTFDAVKEKQNPHAPQYTSNPPNFRISLECTK